ncbi:putative E3 ubiquitin-protein ligase ARI13 [Cardamine amara subsp. amara]|uniref:RBR-type E3 ubiquitin transferase n=1 Tax=Cardamine amara subsp. amara TaxID=228776 RepID=A0ABD1AB29_CARAN
MEYDQERPYSVLTKDEVKEKMKKQILELSEVLLLPKSDATVLLMYQRWGTHWISDFLGENKEKVLTESGLKSVAIDSNQDLSDISCGICSKTSDKFYEFGDDDDNKDDGDVVEDDLIISTPFCSHKFCITCWREYLEKNFYSVEKTQTSISCPHQDCQAAVGSDTIEKLTIEDQEMYEKYVLRSYLEGNLELSIKKCPAPDCDYAIEFRREYEDAESSLNMVCLCGHIFCWRCMLESHRPVTCNNASDWLSRDLNKLSDESLSLSWIENNSKPCPNCLSPMVLDGPLQDRFLTCTCSFSFCWTCLKSKEYHTRFYGACAEPILKRGAQGETSCFDRWEACKILMEQAKSNLQALEESNMDTESLRKGLMLLVQCRQVLKWTCVYDYLHAEYESSKREYLRFLQEQASDQVQSYSETLKKETERALSEEPAGCVRGASCIDTSNIGNYFYHFIKTLQDGLEDVKVKSYNDYGGLYWSCDRCTSVNSWLHMECKTCFDATASPKEKSD